MKILLLGYGKMGQTIASIAVEKGHTIVGRINGPEDPKGSFSTENTDVAIEFSEPGAAVANISWALENGIPVVSGTTGWLAHYHDMITLCNEQNGSLFYASNFSLGVNIFFRLNEFLARLMATHPGYEVAMQEIHHVQKKDSPSGTAITLADTILKYVGEKTSWKEGESNDPSVLSIEALRRPDVPGTHSITYSSEEDQIEIIHTAHSRRGFATGALAVAEWIRGKKGVLGMDDYLKF